MKPLSTASVQFLSPVHAHNAQKLFSINPNVDAKNALYVASSLIDSVMDTVTDAAVGDAPLQGNGAVMVSHTLSSALAILDALVRTIELNDLNLGA